MTVITWGWGYYTTTDAEGRYTLANLEPRAYGLTFQDEQMRYPKFDAPEAITVALEQTATLDVQLRPYGYLSGRVTAAESGQPLGGIVCFCCPFLLL